MAKNMTDLLEKFRRNHSNKIDFSDEFTPPVYNIWKQREKSNEVSHFGNTEVLHGADTCNGFKYEHCTFVYPKLSSGEFHQIKCG